VTSAAAATWSTAAGVLTIDGDDGIVLNTGGSGDLQINENILVGADDAGHDVKFFGNTASEYMLWDTSHDRLVVIGEVGIGTATPNAYSNYGVLTINGSTGGVVDLEVNGTRTTALYALSSGTHLSTVTAGEISLYTTDTKRLSIAAASAVVTIGGAVSADTAIVFDNGGTDYHVGIDQTADDLVIGTGTALGSNTVMQINSTGQTAFGRVPLDYRQVDIGGSWTSGGASATAVVLSVSGTMTGASGDTTYLVGSLLSANITTQTASEDIALVAQVKIDEPTITDQLGGSNVITNAASLYIEAAPTEGDTGNYALFVDDGDSRFDGDITIQTAGDGNRPYYTAYMYSDTAADRPYLSFRRSNNDTEGTLTAMTDGDYLGTINFLGIDSGGNWDAGAGIDVVHSGSVGTKVPVTMTIATHSSTAKNTDQLVLDSTGAVFIGDNANANSSKGLTINQGAADDQAFALKSSDVDHGLTTGTAGGSDVEIDDYFTIEKMVAGTSGGGVRMNVMMEDVAQRPAFQLGVYGGTAQTDKSTSARGLAEIYVSEHADNNSLADIAANGNVFNISARVGDTDATVFLVDEDGQIYATTNAHTGDVSVGALSDNYDDAQLVRTLDHAKTSAGFKGMIRDKWDDFVQYNEQDLIDAGVLGETMENGGLLNVTGLQKLHNGAIWQGYKRQMELQEEVTELKTRLLALEGAK